MVKEISKPWREDKDIEQIFMDAKAINLEDVPSKAELRKLQQFLEALINKVRSQDEEMRSQRRAIVSIIRIIQQLKKIHQEEVGENLQQLKEKSRVKALELRKELGLTDDPMKIDGFDKIKGLLSKYAKPNDDAVELLRTSRDEG